MKKRYERRVKIFPEIYSVETVSVQEIKRLHARAREAAFHKRIDRMAAKALEEISSSVRAAKDKILGNPIDKLIEDHHHRQMLNNLAAYGLSAQRISPLQMFQSNQLNQANQQSGAFGSAGLGLGALFGRQSWQ